MRDDLIGRLQADAGAAKEGTGMGEDIGLLMREGAETIRQLRGEVERLRSAAVTTERYCQECWFWVRVERDHGLCRRHAPKAFVVQRGAGPETDDSSVTGPNWAGWPETCEDDWCGEWRGKPVAEPVGEK